MTNVCWKVEVRGPLRSFAPHLQEAPTDSTSALGVPPEEKGVTFCPEHPAFDDLAEHAGAHEEEEEEDAIYDALPPQAMSAESLKK